MRFRGSPRSWGSIRKRCGRVSSVPRSTTAPGPGPRSGGAAEEVMKFPAFTHRRPGSSSSHRNSIYTRGLQKQFVCRFVWRVNVRQIQTAPRNVRWPTSHRGSGIRTTSVRVQSGDQLIGNHCPGPRASLCALGHSGRSHCPHSDKAQRRKERGIGTDWFDLGYASVPLILAFLISINNI